MKNRKCIKFVSVAIFAIATIFFALILLRQKMENKAIIWSTVHSNYTNADDAGHWESDDTFVGDTGFIKKCPLAVKTIIAFFANIPMYGDSELCLAKALGNFSSLQEARDSLLYNRMRVFKDISIEEFPANFEIEIERNTVWCKFSGVWGKHIKTLEFKMKKNGDIECVNSCKQEPEAPICTTVIEIDNSKIYLKSIHRLSEDSFDTELKPVGNGDFFIQFETLTGDYPETYVNEISYLHIIPENNKMKFETFLILRWIYKDGQLTESFSKGENTEIADKWTLAGYSNDKNNLYAKIFQWYQENPE